MNSWVCGKDATLISDDSCLLACFIWLRSRRWGWNHRRKLLIWPRQCAHHHHHHHQIRSLLWTRRHHHHHHRIRELLSLLLWPSQLANPQIPFCLHAALFCSVEHIWAAKMSCNRLSLLSQDIWRRKVFFIISARQVIVTMSLTLGKKTVEKGKILQTVMMLIMTLR